MEKIVFNIANGECLRRRSSAVSAGEDFSNENSCNAIKENMGKENGSNVRRTISNPIAIPRRSSTVTPVDDFKTNEMVRQFSSNSENADNDFSKKTEVQEKIHVSSIRIRNRKCSQPVTQSDLKNVGQKNEMNCNTGISSGSDVNNSSSNNVTAPVEVTNKRYSVQLPLKENFINDTTSNEDSFFNSHDLKKSPIEVKKRGGSLTLERRKSPFNGKRFSQIFSDSTLLVDRKDSNTSVSSCDLDGSRRNSYEIMSPKGQVSNDSTITRRGSSGNSSPAVSKKISQYRIALESMSRKSSGNGSPVSGLTDISSQNGNLESSSGGENLPVNRKKSDRSFIGSKKKSLVEKFEKIASGVSNVRRRKSALKKKSVSMPNNDEKTLDITESEKPTDRSYSVDHSSAADVSAESKKEGNENLEQPKRKVSQRKYSVDHTNNLKEFESGHSVKKENTKFRRFSVDHAYSQSTSKKEFEKENFPKFERTVIQRKFSVDHAIKMKELELEEDNQREELFNPRRYSVGYMSSLSEKIKEFEKGNLPKPELPAKERRFSVDHTYEMSKISENETNDMQRRYSVDLKTNTWELEDTNQSEKKVIRHRFSGDHASGLSTILQESESAYSPKTMKKIHRNFSIDHSFNLPSKLDALNSLTISKNKNGQFSIDHSISSYVLSMELKDDDRISIKLPTKGADDDCILEKKPPKKDSGNYDDDHLFLPTLKKDISDVDEVTEDDLDLQSHQNVSVTPDDMSKGARVAAEITYKNISNLVEEKVEPALHVTQSIDIDINQGGNRSYDSDTSESSYNSDRKISVIRRPSLHMEAIRRSSLSVEAVSQIKPVRKRSHVVLSHHDNKKTDEESGFFDSHNQMGGNQKNADNEGLCNESDAGSDDTDDRDYDRNVQRKRDNDSLNKLDIDASYSEEQENAQFVSLGDLRNGELIGIEDRTQSFNSCDSSSPYDQNDNQKISYSDEPVQVRRRKYGTASIVSLDELPKRRMSRVVDWFVNNEAEASSHESCYIPENVSRKMSLYGQFLTFDDLFNEGMEVVADKETRDIISVSHGTLSSCSEQVPFRPPSLYRSDLQSLHSFDKLRIDEETTGDFGMKEDDEDNSSTSSSSSVNAQFEISDDESESLESSSSADTVRDIADIENDGSGVISDTSTEADGEMLDCEAMDEERESANAPIFGSVCEKAVYPDERELTTFSTMFGYFNYCLYNFISKEYTVEKWKEIIGSLNLTRKQVAMFEKPKHTMFDDSITDQVLRTAAQMLNINFNRFLQTFGNSYFEWCYLKYDALLKSIATNLADFINNMDDVRRHIHKIEKIADDYPPSIYALLDKQGTLLVYYHSYRDQQYLEYFLIGFMKQVAWVLYGMRSRVSIQQQRQNCEDFSVISIKAVNSLVKKPSVSKLQVSTRCKDLVMEPYLMDAIFPFHIILNDQLEICQLGDSLNRLLEKYIPEYGLNIRTYFKVLKPVIEDLNYSSVRNNLNTAFILSSHAGMFTETFSRGLVLKGQVSYLETSRCLWFIGSPKIDYVHQLNGESNLYLSDIPLHDATREVLLVSERTHEQDALKKQLQVLTNRLKETSKELALGKINTENILDEIFPKDVAERLMRDLPVPAVTLEEVSILFTDIVGFTSICGKCDPEDVTEMLNSLYLEFDFLCEKFDLYKVETIGDAYMVVGGLHQNRKSNNDHGRYTTAMGIEMITHAKNVLTPQQEEIEIRVGVHSGSVVAGVVGTRMPRYCLFGNNVSLANQMESTSEKCKVHISPATYLEIKHHQEFIFYERPRDVMPPLMQKLYHQGHTYFVSQRRPSTYEVPTFNNKRLEYMMPRRISEEQFLKAPASRKTSRSESVISDIEKYPKPLRKQLEALAKINNPNYAGDLIFAELFDDDSSN